MPFGGRRGRWPLVRPRAIRTAGPLLRAAWRLWAIVVWLLLGLSAPALAQAAPEAARDAIVARAWLDDPQGTLTPQAALARAWKPHAGPLARGYRAGDTWLRLAIDPAMLETVRLAGDNRLVLSIQPGLLDEITVFRPDRPVEPPRVLGDTHEPPDPEFHSLGHALVIPDAVAPFDLLLRLRTVSHHTIHVQALGWEDAREAEFRLRSVVIAYLVFLAMVLVFAVFIWLGGRDRVLGLFVLHQIAALLLAVTLLGVARLLGSAWIPVRVIDVLTSVMVPMQVAMALLFHAALLRDLGCREPDWKLLRAAVMVPAVALLLIAVGQTRAGLQLNNLAVLLLSPLLILIAWRVRPKGAGSPGAQRGILISIYVLMSAFFLPPSMVVLGLVAAGNWTYGGFMAHGVASALLLGALVVFRAREDRRRRAEAARALAQVRREAESQRARATEQSELMTMVAHELKTPLSVFSLALGSAGQQPRMRERALRAVESMREVIDRCADVARFDDEFARNDALPVTMPLALDGVLAEAVRRQVAAARIDCDVAEGLPACRADRQLLLVIIGNLLENAAKYGPPQARIRASIERANRDGRPGVALRVANAVGPAGRPDAARLFEKYYRGEHARRQAGSGLGLYLSRRLALRLGGELSLHDSHDVSLELWLPA